MGILLNFIVFRDDEGELEELEIDEAVNLTDLKKTFLFLVDRSGSMSGSKMNITN